MIKNARAAWTNYDIRGNKSLTRWTTIASKNCAGRHPLMFLRSPTNYFSSLSLKIRNTIMEMITVPVVIGELAQFNEPIELLDPRFIKVILKLSFDNFFRNTSRFPKDPRLRILTNSQL